MALDPDEAITVTCYKKGPSDGGFSSFYTTSLAIPGNTGDCPVSLSTGGTYQFYVTANEAISDTVSVTYNGVDGPDKPTSYSKEKLSCDYKIKFHTADDGGRTKKVEIYRSDKTSFNADPGTRVGTVNIGSNQDGEFLQNLGGECSKEYYYVIRAFDEYGNGSGWVGDSVVVNLTPAPVATGVGLGAVPVAIDGPAVLGEETATESGEESVNGEVKGEETVKMELEKKLADNKILVIGLGTLILIVGAYLYSRRRP